MKHTNYIRAIIVSGNYKDKNLEIQIGKTGDETKIFINKKQITNCLGACIQIKPNKPTTLVFELFKGDENK
jgi:hypothetical protein